MQMTMSWIVINQLHEIDWRKQIQLLWILISLLFAQDSEGPNTNNGIKYKLQLFYANGESN